MYMYVCDILEIIIHMYTCRSPRFVCNEVLHLYIYVKNYIKIGGNNISDLFTCVICMYLTHQNLEHIYMKIQKL